MLLAPLTIAQKMIVTRANKLYFLLYPNNLKNWIWAEAKLARFNDQKDPHIPNMGVFLIVESRGFGSAEIPILEVVWVYTLRVLDYRLLFTSFLSL